MGKFDGKVVIITGKFPQSWYEQATLFATSVHWSACSILSNVTVRIIHFLELLQQLRMQIDAWLYWYKCAFLVLSLLSIANYTICINTIAYCLSSETLYAIYFFILEVSTTKFGAGAIRPFLWAMAKHFVRKRRYHSSKKYRARRGAIWFSRHPKYCAVKVIYETAIVASRPIIQKS